MYSEDAGKQSVAMSLSALIYNKLRGIHGCNDLVQIMEMIICTGQVYLMLTLLPSMNGNC